MNPWAYSQIPYAMEQGIFECLAGNFQQRAGNLQGILLILMMDGPMTWFAERPLGIEGDAWAIF